MFKIGTKQRQVPQQPLSSGPWFPHCQLGRVGTLDIILLLQVQLVQFAHCRYAFRSTRNCRSTTTDFRRCTTVECNLPDKRCKGRGWVTKMLRQMVASVTVTVSHHRCRQALAHVFPLLWIWIPDHTVQITLLPSILTSHTPHDLESHPLLSLDVWLLP